MTETGVPASQAGSTVLVTGASGRLGSAVVPRLAEAGYDVRPMSRRARPGWASADVTNGRGLAAAVRGVDAIVNLVTSQTRWRTTDVDGTRRLLAVAKAAGVRHVVHLSIVGIDRVSMPYYRAKLAAEAVVCASGVPFTILRATQFFPLLDTILSASSRLGPTIVDPSFVFQPVHVSDVAERIAAVLAAESSGEAGDFGGLGEADRAVAGSTGVVVGSGAFVEFAGPEVLEMAELARQWQEARGRRRPIWSVRVPGQAAKAVRSGALTTGSQLVGSRTWHDFLADRY